MSEPSVCVVCAGDPLVVAVRDRVEPTDVHRVRKAIEQAVFERRPDALVLELSVQPVSWAAASAVVGAASVCHRRGIDAVAVVAASAQGRNLVALNAPHVGMGFHVCADRAQARAVLAALPQERPRPGPGVRVSSEADAEGRTRVLRVEPEEGLLPGLGGLPRRPQPGATADGRGSALRSRSRELFERLAELEPGTRAYSATRTQLIEVGMPLVEFALRDFRSSSVPREDLRQTGMIGLIKAVDAFDPALGYAFATYALPTIRGEIRRHLRDTTWDVHVPRSVQESYLAVHRTGTAIEDRTGRPAGTQQIADELGMTPRQVEEARAAAGARTTRSLDFVVDDDGAVPLAERLGGEDTQLELLVECLALKPLIAALPDRERAALALRFGAELTQEEIGRRLGVSQVHVSRLLRRALARLHRALAAADEAR